METIYDVNYFIKKFQAIPEELWHVGDLFNKDRTRFCALGFCGETESINNSEGNSLRALSRFYCGFNIIGSINDGTKNTHEINLDEIINRYTQPTPKLRILAFLYDIYEKTYNRKYGEPTVTIEEPPKEKVIYKTVVIDSAVKELQTSLTEN